MRSKSGFFAENCERMDKTFFVLRVIPNRHAFYRGF